MALAVGDLTWIVRGRWPYVAEITKVYKDGSALAEYEMVNGTQVKVRIS